MGRPSVEEDTKRFLKALKSKGGSAGNVTLRKELGWDERRYWRTQGILFEDEVITRGKGKGGSVALRKAETPQTEIVKISKAERDLYKPSLEQIQTRWLDFHEYDDGIAEITASQGRRQTGGTWTRPDITVVATRSFEFYPQRVFDIVTFEIKTADNINVQAVFEAVSHRVFATRAFVLVAIDEDNFAKINEAERIKEEAKKNGIGIILAPDIAEFGTWLHPLPAVRYEPDPKEADKFIRTTFAAESRTAIVKWQK